MGFSRCLESTSSRLRVDLKKWSRLQVDLAKVKKWIFFKSTRSRLGFKSSRVDSESTSPYRLRALVSSIKESHIQLEMPLDILALLHHWRREMIACGINESTRCSFAFKVKKLIFLFFVYTESRNKKSELKSGSDIHKRTSTWIIKMHSAI